MKGVQHSLLIASILVFAGCGGPKPPADRQPIEFPPPHPETPAVTVDPLLDRAAVGDAASQFKLGARLDEQKSYNDAAKWYRLAAEQGHREAQFNFACMLSKGLGIETDALKAAEWCRKAAEQGLVEAQFNLGNYFEEGKGVVAEGFLKDRSFLVADKILAKHDENYMPPEVKEALESK